MNFTRLFRSMFVFIILVILISLAALIGGGYWLLTILEQAVQ